MKKCTKCLIGKNESEFYKLKNIGPKTAKSGLKAKCKECEKKWYQEYSKTEKFRQRTRFLEKKRNKPEVTRKKSLKQLYGITVEQYDSIFTDQNGNCKICGINQSKLTKPLFVDHCHYTEKIRGLLCGKCNSGLGFFCDSSELLAKAKEYIDAP